MITSFTALRRLLFSRFLLLAVANVMSWSKLQTVAFLSCFVLFLLFPATLWPSINREREQYVDVLNVLIHLNRTDPVLGCSLPTTQLCPDLVLLFLCSCNNVLFTALPGHTVGLSVNPCHCMLVFHLLSLCVSVPPSLPVCFFLPPCLSLSLSVCLSFPHTSVHSSVVEEPSPVSENKTPLVGPPSGQGPVPLSVICWYRVQSLSFSESCRSLEVKEPGRQERPCVYVLFELYHRKQDL